MTVTLNKQQMDEMKSYLIGCGDVKETIPLPQSLADGYELAFLGMTNLGDEVVVMYQWRRRE